jgi:preprotein translocase subunit SecD
MRLALVLVLVACGSKKTPPKPCERGARVELRDVDNDSPYMKQLFAHVGSEGRAGAPTDPRAIELGVRAEVDQWRRDTSEDEIPGMRPDPTQIDYYLLAYDQHALPSYLSDYEKPPSDREIVIERGDPLPDMRDRRPYWRTYYVIKQPIFDTRAISYVTTVDDPDTQRRLVAVDLTPEGRETFRVATARAAKAGKKIAILVDGQVSSAPIINAEITSPRFMLYTPATETEALRKKLACVTSRAP